MSCYRAVVSVIVAAALFWPAAALAAESLQLEIDAGEFDRAGVPICCPLPGETGDWQVCSLAVEKTGKSVPCQVVKESKPRLVFMLEEPLLAGKSRRYRLRKEDRARAEKGQYAVKVARDDRALSITLGDKPVLTYNHAVVPSDDPKEPAYRRSGFIHPLYDPQGNVVSDGMPPDHMHQHGIMYAWVDTTFRDHAVDFWNSAKHAGTVRHREVLATEDGPVLARFRTSLEHVDLTEKQAKEVGDPADPAAGTVVLREIWQLTVYNRTDGFLFDIESEQCCATDDALVINKYHYGGMAFRGARHWSGAQGCRFLTGEGKDRTAGNHTRAWWCDISGAAHAPGAADKEAKTSGLTVFCAPENFRAPQAVRLHPTMPYFVWSPMVEEGFRIEPGSPYRARYRYFVHAGPLDKGVAEQISNDFRSPVKVRLTE
jgi:hypothetical protein